MKGPALWEICVRLALAAVLGAAIGAERESGGQDAGLRTHLMLALGAAVFGVISVGAWDHFITSKPTNVSIDVSRVASYVAAGVGFLGGGAILKHTGGVRGMTTAASLWVVAGVGLAAGLGMWVAALAATGIALLSLVGLRPVRNAVRRASRDRGSELTVVLRSGASPSSVLRELDAAAVTPTELHVGPRETGGVEVLMRCDPTDRAVLSDLASRMSALDDVSEVHVGRV
jgi:putative Mg2+ transporter-C (MgtC) family protein